MTDSAIPSKATGTFRILHISDLHTGLADWKWSYLLDKRFFGRLNQFTTRQRKLALQNIEKLAENYTRYQADMLVCTGDLTSIGSREEFQHAQELLAPLLQAAGKNFLYVPGNHDAYVPQNRAALADAFRMLNGDRLQLADLPQTFCVGPVEFVCLSPARPCPIWLSTGELSPAAWEKLDYILSLPAQARIRVLVTHFPLHGPAGRPLSWRTKFVDFPRLSRWGAEGKFHAILSGHVHCPFLIPPQKEAYWQIGAGSLTIQNSFSLVDIPGTGEEIAPKILHF